MPLPKVTLTAALAVAVGVALPLTAQATTTAKTGPTKAATVHSRYGLGYVAPATRLAAAYRSSRPSTLIPADDLPDYVDLSQSMPPVGDQGQVGDCVEWAIDYGLMGYYANVAHSRNYPYQPMSVYRMIAGSGMPSVGTDPAKALAFNKATGVISQSAYWQGSQDYTDAPTTSEKGLFHLNKITGYSTLWTGLNQGTAAKTAIEEALAQHNPVAIGFNVYQSFEDWGQTIAPYTTDSGSNLGGHMTAVFGYDDDGVWINNSWGTGWGMAGTAHLAWSWIEANVSAAYTIAGVTSASNGYKPTIISQSTKTASVDGGTTLTMQLADIDAYSDDLKLGGNLGPDVSLSYSNTWGKQYVTATLPAHAVGSVALTIGGTFGENLKAGTITYLPDAPTVDSLSVNTGPVNGGTTVVVTGTNFIDVTKVVVGTTKVTAKVLSPTSLSFKTPKSATGSRAIVVTNTGGTSATSDGDLFYFGMTPPSSG